jgi:ankyrin repeat protein/L-ascorbate metabolism protein UlaG (beta-lactamase superfamily)
MQSPGFLARFGMLVAVAALALVALAFAEARAAEPAGAPPAIHKAAESGDLDRIRDLVHEDAGAVAATNGQGFTPLHVAAVSGQRQAAELLLALGANVNATANDGTTPLHVAAANGRNEMVSFLASKGADITHADPSGMTPLHFAAYAGHTATAEALISLGADVDAQKINGSRPIHGAALGGFTETVAMLLARGADANTPNRNGYTPFLTACSTGRLDVMKMLLDAGADPMAKLPDGGTALHVAVQSGSKEAVDLLLTRGFNLAAAAGSEASVLAFAVFGGNLEIIKSLVEAGARVNPDPGSEMTPLGLAIEGNKIEIAEYLISKGADVNAGNRTGVTTLAVAVQSGSTDMVKLLLRGGADPNLKDTGFGRTALHTAALAGYRNMVEALLDGGAAVNATDLAGRTPLELAARHGHKSVAQTLKARGGKADKLEENYGRSPLLSKNLRTGEAEIWYLGHCGYAVKTQKHLLVFDYWPRGAAPETPCLANGHVDPSEIADLDVTVFATHDHADHFDSTIFDWAKQVKHITYVYGFKPEESPQARETGYRGPAYTFIGPRETKKVGDLEVATIAANDAGVGFVVQADGLTLFHAGDHAGWAEGEKQGYLDEIDYLADKGLAMDLTFINVTGCHAHNPDALKEGNLYTIGKLSPKAVFPTHGVDRESVYAEAAKAIADAGVKTPVACPQARGDHYFYSKGQLR